MTRNLGPVKYKKRQKYLYKKFVKKQMGRLKKLFETEYPLPGISGYRAVQVCQARPNWKYGLTHKNEEDMKI